MTANHRIENGNADSNWRVILAHGAGAGMDTEFMNFFAEGLAERGCHVVRFEFPYMNERRRTGKKRPPDSQAKLKDSWIEVVESLRGPKLIIGGKSMGGRIASLVADELNVGGLVCLGYPFHPTGKPEKLRTEHLEKIATPTLVVQGQRDPFGNRGEVSNYQLSDQIRLTWLTDGDHDLKPRKNSGKTQRENWEEGVEAAATFILSK